MFIRPIETAYNNYRFRSRLEARWAIFFDAQGIEYQYEPEGYDLGGEWYLPDFWLPQVNMWAEVKAQKLSDRERMLAERLVVATLSPCLQLIGTPDARAYRAIELCDTGTPFATTTEVEYMLVTRYIETESRFFWSQYAGGEAWILDPAYYEAVTSARQARFEYGETPSY